MFPISIDLSNETVIVAGGGPVALHKVKNLLRFQLNVTIVSPEFHPGFIQLADEGKVHLVTKKAEWDDVKEAFLLITVTNDEAVNNRLAIRAKESGMLVVHSSNPSLGNSQIPAVVQRGKLAISVSTGGASPTLAVQIRNRLAKEFDERYETYVDFLYEIRSLIKEHMPERSERQKWLKQAADPLYLENPQQRESFKNKLHKFIQ